MHSLQLFEEVVVPALDEATTKGGLVAAQLTSA